MSITKRKFNPLGCYLSLACSITSLTIACGSLLQIPNTTDRITLQRGLFLTSMGFLYFVSLTDFFNKYLLESPQGIRFRKKYRLMISDVLEITNKLVSAIQASFCSLAGFLVCKSTCSKTFVYASHFIMEAYAWFGTAYFIYDIWSMYVVHTQKIADKLKLIKISNGELTPRAQMTNGQYDKYVASSLASNGHSSNTGDSSPDTPSLIYHKKHHETEFFDYDGETIEIPKDGRWDFLKYIVTHPVMMIHHVFLGTFGLLVVTYLRGGGHCIYSFIFMMECSTPFVSLRSILSTLGLKDSRSYIINGLVMLGTFFIFRILMWPYVFWSYSEAINLPFFEAIIGLPKGCIISILILLLPQLYWFFLMVKGALKVFFPSPSPKTKSSPEIAQFPNGGQSLPTLDIPVGKNLNKNGNISTDLKTRKTTTNGLN